MKLVPFDETILREMQDPEVAAAYLQEALEESPKAFLHAFFQYLQATESLETVAEKVGIHPSLLSLWFTSAADPGLKQVCELLTAAGMILYIDARSDLALGQIDQTSANDQSEDGTSTDPVFGARSYLDN